MYDTVILYHIIYTWDIVLYAKYTVMLLSLSPRWCSFHRGHIAGMWELHQGGARYAEMYTCIMTHSVEIKVRTYPENTNTIIYTGV